jgi:ABC-type transport system involved in multi-copper enzyme maturation permease subunit
MSANAARHLLKDGRITRIFWAPAAFSFFAMMLVFFENPWVYLMAGVGLTFAMAVIVLAIEDAYRTAPFLAALPGTRRSIVAGRYLSWSAATTFGLLLFLGTTAAILATIGERSGGLDSLLKWKGACAFFALSLAAGLLFLPFHFRFGFWKGLWIFAVAVAAAALAFLILAPVLATPSGETGITPGTAPRGSLAGILTAVGEIAGRAAKASERPLALAAAAAALAGLGLLSFRLSVAFYKKRDL